VATALRQTDRPLAVEHGPGAGSSDPFDSLLTSRVQADPQTGSFPRRRDLRQGDRPQEVVAPPVVISRPAARSAAVSEHRRSSHHGVTRAELREPFRTAPVPDWTTELDDPFGLLGPAPHAPAPRRDRTRRPRPGRAPRGLAFNDLSYPSSMLSDGRCATDDPFSDDPLTGSLLTAALLADVPSAEALLRESSPAEDLGAFAPSGPLPVVPSGPLSLVDPGPTTGELAELARSRREARNAERVREGRRPVRPRVTESEPVTANPRKLFMIRGGVLVSLLAVGGAAVTAEHMAKADADATATREAMWTDLASSAGTVADATDQQARAVLLGQSLTAAAIEEAAGDADGQVGLVVARKKAEDQAEADRIAAIERAAAKAAAKARAEAKAKAIRDARSNPKEIARIMAADRGWGDGQFSCLNLLWTRESGWNYRATNASSGAYGIPQALPGSKMGTVASDWRTNPITQITWGLDYIADRYGTPCGAWAHSQSYGWY